MNIKVKTSAAYLHRRFVPVLTAAVNVSVIFALKFAVTTRYVIVAIMRLVLKYAYIRRISRSAYKHEIISVLTH